VLIVGAAIQLPGQIRTGSASNPPESALSLPHSQRPEASSPSEVSGLRVLTVGDAFELLRAGKLDGRAVAVAGYFGEFIPSCPFPGRYIGPLEGWCDMRVLADTPAGARLCTMSGNTTGCHGPGPGQLQPFFVSETSGMVSGFAGNPNGEPTAVIVIGHGGDARQWLCDASKQDQCAHAFVVDRVAWANGNALPVAAPETGDQTTGAPIRPTRNLDGVLAAAGLGDLVVTAAPFHSADIAIVDPRWPMSGNAITWIVRSLAVDGVGADGTIAEVVTLVDDKTGQVIDQQLMALDPAYNPARVWRVATVHGYECCPGDLFAFSRMQSDEGRVVHEGSIPGGVGGGEDGVTTFGGSYGSSPLVLPAGNYTITMWLAGSLKGGTTRGECSTRLSLRPGDDIRINADFPLEQPCTFMPAPDPTPVS